MKLEDQVCSLELSKRLKELGVRQESAFYWVNHIWRGKYPEHEEDLILLPNFQVNEGLYPLDYWERIAAFTVAELGEMLGEHVFSEYEHDLSLPWKCTFDEGYMKPKRFEYADTEANARAKMLVYLIEQGIVQTGHDFKTCTCHPDGG